MEESSGSFSAIFNAKKSTLCLHEAEIEITNGKCLIRGQAAFLREECPTGISLRSFSEKQVVHVIFFVYIVRIISNGFIVLLCSGVKCTYFIIPREVHVNEAATPHVAVAAHCATSPRPSDSVQHTPKKPPQKETAQAGIPGGEC